MPWNIEKILQGDYASIKKQLMYLFESGGNGSGIGMRLSVWCAEEYPFSSQQQIQQESSKYPAVRGLSPATYEEDICEIWGVQAADIKEDQPVKSDIPVLLINGSYDELTPVEWAASMQQNLSNSYHIIFEGWKHTPTTNWGNNCAMIAANDFFNNPSQSPTSACLENIQPVQFKIKK